MQARPFVCIPTLWLSDPGLGRCGEARELAFVLALASDPDWRIGPLNAARVGFSLRNLLFGNQPEAFDFWSEAKIDRCLPKLQAQGVIGMPERHGENAWLLIDERLRYRKGRNLGKGPPVPHDAELPIDGPELFVIDGNGIRDDSEKIIRDDSARALTTKNRSRALSSCRESESENGKGEGDRRFARDGEDFPDDEVWRDCISVLGLVEMTSHGDLWAKRLRTDRRRLALALEAFKVKTPSERATIGNVGAYVTSMFERERSDHSSSPPIKESLTGGTRRAV